nr:MAG TPA: hypothetical protein [Caudoviricetes sp.]
MYPFFYPFVIYGLLTFCLLCPLALSLCGSISRFYALYNETTLPANKN